MRDKKNRARGRSEAVDRVDVMCNGTQAVYLMATQTIMCQCQPCKNDHRVMSPTEFEVGRATADSTVAPRRTDHTAHRVVVVHS